VDPSIWQSSVLNVLCGLLAGGGTLVGGAIITYWQPASREFLKYFIALGAGFMLAVVFLSIIPESMETFNNTLGFVLGGYVLMHLTEQLVSPHFHFGEETHTDVMVGTSASVAAVVGLGVHAFFDGASIGSAFAIQQGLGILVFSAIVLHKIPEGFTIASVMLAAGRGTKAGLLAAGIIGFLTLAGALTAFSATILAPMILALSAGVMCYVAATDLIPEINGEHKVSIPLTVAAGIVIFAGLHSFIS
jgi:zinc transporter ZupT